MKKSALYLAVTVALLTSAAGCGKQKAPENAQESATGDTATVITRTEPVAEGPDIPPAKRRYAVRNGIVQIESDVGGGIRQTLYFADYGLKQATHTFTAAGDSAVQITADGYITDYNLRTRIGHRRRDSAWAMQMPDISSLTPAQRKQYNIKDLEDRQYLGMPCKGYSINMMGVQTKAWAWHNLTMYAQAITPKGTFTTRVTDIQADAGVAPGMFAAPPGIQIQNQ